jgi:diphosphomevalonate decarboxylase
MKATAIAPSNIAFIKYWGKKDEELRLPSNGSVSVNLSGLKTTTTVEFSKDFIQDLIIIDGKQDTKKEVRVIYHLDRIRKLAGFKHKAKVISKNNFPIASGLASSASGFAALTVASVYAAGLSLSEKELTVLARTGSGSACRSIPDGFVEWFEGKDNNSSYAVSIFPPEYWDINIVSVLITKKEKDISSSKGQELAKTSPFFSARLDKIAAKIIKLKQLIKRKDFVKFGELIEEEALELHAITMTSTPSILYLQPETIKIINLIWEWRRKGLLVYFTIDAGPNLHLICQKTDLNKLLGKLKPIKGIKKLIVSNPSIGTKLTNNHLFYK